MTLGAGAPTDYITSKSLTVSTTSAESYGYNVSTFGFGVVYETNGVASSSYFHNMTSAVEYPAYFSINFQGLGLPGPMFNEFSELIKNLTYE